MEVHGGVRQRVALPFVPAQSSTVPIEAVMPTAMVEISGCTRFMVSWIASPAGITPPGELMYIWMSRSGSSRARYSSCATIMFAT